MNENFIKELVDIKEDLIQKKLYIESPNTFKLFFLIKNGLKENVSLEDDKVIYIFQYDIEKKEYLGFSKNDTTKEIVTALNGDIDDILLKSLCVNNGIEMLKNFIDSENKVVVYSFSVDLNYNNLKRVIK